MDMTRRSHRLFQSVIFLLAFTFAASDSHFPPTLDHGVDLDTKAPLIIGHRGASGILPEHTVEAYQLAIDQGADVIECDMCLTKDLHIVCLHESWLSATTDVANITKFADRKTTYEIPREYYESKITQTVDDWFSVDFTLAELKELRKRQQEGIRDPNFDGIYQIATLEELITVVKAAGRKVGLHLESKAPRWVNSLPILNGTSFEDVIVKTLTKHGYTKNTDPCFLQSFSQESLVSFKNKTDLPLVRLIEDQATNVSEPVLKEWSQMFYGIGPWKELIVPSWTSKDGYKNKLGNVTRLIELSHKYALAVHVYTFRNEDKYLAWDYQQDPLKEYEYFMQLRVDGFFTDFPGTLKRYMKGLYKEETKCPNPNPNPSSGTDLSCNILKLITVISIVVYGIYGF